MILRGGGQRDFITLFFSLIFLVFFFSLGPTNNQGNKNIPFIEFTAHMSHSFILSHIEFIKLVAGA